jgi:proline dehydrogenase
MGNLKEAVQRYGRWNDEIAQRHGLPPEERAARALSEARRAIDRTRKLRLTSSETIVELRNAVEALCRALDK